MNAYALAVEKHRADAMRQITESPEQDYWMGYRIGLTADSPHAAALLGAVGGADRARDARGRGYRDGCAYRQRRTA